MIFNLFFGFIVDVIGSVFSLVPTITTLPTIAGFDIDTAIVQGIGQLRTIMVSFWFLGTMFQGFLALMLFYLTKIILRFLIGHRSPA